MVNEIHRHFKHTDAWLLLALLVNHEKGASTLDRLIATADLINHAIPTARQLDGGINRLLHAGLVCQICGGFDATDKGVELLQPLVKNRFDYGDLKTVERFLFELQTPNEIPRSVTIDEGSARDAYNTYVMQLRRR